MPAKALSSISDFMGNEDTIRKSPSRQVFQRRQNITNLHYKYKKERNISLVI